MRIWIIGGTSFIGPHVVRLLEQWGHQIMVFHRGHTDGGLPGSVRHIYGERGQLDRYMEDIRLFAPDVVLDMILYSEKEACTLVDAFSGTVPRIVAVSSQDVYRAYAYVRRTESGGPDDVPLTERSPLRRKLYPYRDPGKDPEDWCNTYDKIVAERIVMNSRAIAGTVLRLPAVYGPGDMQRRFYSYLNLKRMVDGRRRIVMDEGFAHWRWTHSYVENAARAIAAAVVDPRSSGRIYNVGEPYTPTMYEFVTEIGRQAGWKGEIVIAPTHKVIEPLRFPLDTAQSLSVDSTLIREELSFRETVSWQEGIARTVEWERTTLPDPVNPSHPEFDYRQEDEFLRTLDIST